MVRLEVKGQLHFLGRISLGMEKAAKDSFALQNAYLGARYCNDLCIVRWREMLDPRAKGVYLF